MKFKSKEFKKAVEQFQYSLPDGAELEILVREEDLDEGKLCDSFTMVCTYEEKPSTYESNKNPYMVTVSVEIFPQSENRLPRYTLTKSRDLT